jgi:uncharacterized membrane protein (UPF0136 family)
MQTAAMVVWIYGALVLVGGVMGWVKARSKPSLISGIVFGVALILFGYGISQGHAADVWVAIGLAGLLAIIMGIRFAKTKKFMPAGLLAILSAVVVAMLLMR